MDPEAACEIILKTIRTSGLNWSIQESPFSLQISIRKSFVKLKEHSTAGSSKTEVKVSPISRKLSQNICSSSHIKNPMSSSPSKCPMAMSYPTNHECPNQLNLQQPSAIHTSSSQRMTPLFNCQTSPAYTNMQNMGSTTMPSSFLIPTLPSLVTLPPAPSLKNLQNKQSLFTMASLHSMSSPQKQNIKTKTSPKKIASPLPNHRKKSASPANKSQDSTSPTNHLKDSICPTNQQLKDYTSPTNQLRDCSFATYQLRHSSNPTYQLTDTTSSTNHSSKHMSHPPHNTLDSIDQLIERKLKLKLGPTLLKYQIT